MSLAKRYVSLNDEGKTLFWLVFVDVAILLMLTPFFFLSNIGIPLGWLLGSSVSILCYITMVKGSGLLMRVPASANGRNKGMAIAAVFSVLRLVLMLGALALAAFFTFKAEGNFLNFFTTAGAYLPLVIVAVVFVLVHNHRKKKSGEAAPIGEGEKKLEVGEEPLDD